MLIKLGQCVAGAGAAANHTHVVVYPAVGLVVAAACSLGEIEQSRKPARTPIPGN